MRAAFNVNRYHGVDYFNKERFEAFIALLPGCAWIDAIGHSAQMQGSTLQQQAPQAPNQQGEAQSTGQLPVPSYAQISRQLGNLAALLTTESARAGYKIAVLRKAFQRDDRD